MTHAYMAMVATSGAKRIAIGYTKRVKMAAYNPGVLEDYVREGIKQARLHPSRSRGQHFLIDDGVLAQVVTAAQLRGDEAVLEIGPGLGTLTRSLAARCWRVYAFELDDALVRYLQGWVLPEAPNVMLEDVSFNKYVLERVIAQTREAGRNLKIVTNLPYQISSAFLHTVVDYAGELELVVVMLQREVVRRVTAQRAEPGFGSFNIYLQTFLETRYVCDVPAASFLPPPRVESAILTLRPLKPEEQPQPKNRERYFRLVEGVFRHRRKQMLNALRLCFSHMNTADCLAALSAAGIGPELRPAALGLQDYVRLADAIDAAVKPR